MGILLLLVGLLSIASGGFKMPERVRAYAGSSPLAVAEIVLGALTVIGSGMGLSRLRPLAWMVVALVLGLIVVSSYRHARRAIQHTRSQETSEGARLKSYLQSRTHPLRHVAQPDGKSTEQRDK